MAKVVQIDAVKLDSYLKDIKSQLQKHDDELLNPVWLTNIKPEIDKVSLLARKLEYCQLDINALRDEMLSVNDPHSVEISNSKSLDPLRLLKSEIQGVKLVIRRVELQHASELNVLSELRQIQRTIRQGGLAGGGIDKQTAKQISNLIAQVMDIEADLADLRDKQSSFDDMQSKLEDLELAITEVARLNEFQESSYADDDDDDALEINLPQVTASRSSVTAGAARVSLSKPNNDSHSSMIPIPNSSNTNPDGRNVSILDRRRSKLLSNFTFLDNNHRKSSSGAEFPQIRKSGGTMRQTSMKKFVAQEEFNNHSADVFNKIAALGKLVGIATHATALQQGFTVLDRVHQTYSRFRLGRAWWKWKIEWEEFNDLKDADNQVRGREFSAIVCLPKSIN